MRRQERVTEIQDCYQAEPNALRATTTKSSALGDQGVVCSRETEIVYLSMGASSGAGPAPDLGFFIMVVVFLGLPFAVMGAGALWSALMGRLHSDEADRQGDHGPS